MNQMVTVPGNSIAEICCIFNHEALNTRAVMRVQIMNDCM